MSRYNFGYIIKHDICQDTNYQKYEERHRLLRI